MQEIAVTDTQAWCIGLACVLMMADVVAGFVTAVINGNVSSSKMREGLGHKMLLVVLIVTCLAIEIALTHAVYLPFDVPACEVVCGYIVVMELTSVLEHIGVGYPGFSESPLYKLFENRENNNNEK